RSCRMGESPERLVVAGDRNVERPAAPEPRSEAEAGRRAQPGRVAEVDCISGASSTGREAQGRPVNAPRSQPAGRRVSGIVSGYNWRPVGHELTAWGEAETCSETDAHDRVPVDEDRARVKKGSEVAAGFMCECRTERQGRLVLCGSVGKRDSDRRCAAAG